MRAGQQKRSGPYRYAYTVRLEIKRERVSDVDAFVCPFCRVTSLMLRTRGISRSQTIRAAVQFCAERHDAGPMDLRRKIGQSESDDSTATIILFRYIQIQLFGSLCQC